MSDGAELDLEDVVRTLQSDEARKVFEENEVLAVYLFGSMVQKKTHPLSDVDVAVVFERSVPGREYFERQLAILGRLSGLLHTDEVDVVPLNNAPLLLVFHALRLRKLVYAADERRRAEFEIKMFGMYYDFSSVLHEYRTQMFRRIKEPRLT